MWRLRQNAFEEYTGFTEEEVKELCRQYNMDFAETSNWYDGYQFRRFKHVYNPRSVVAAMNCGYFSKVRQNCRYRFATD